MKRFLGFSVAMFIALVAIALVGGDSGAVAGHGCHGRHHRCHGGLLARLHAKHRCHGRCHGEQVAACEGCDSACEGCGEAGGCAGGGCGGEAVISSGTPTEAAAPAAPAAPAAKASGT